jgi:hypothetical protein
MTKTVVRLGSALLFSVFMMSATSRASQAGTLVQVTFSGPSVSGYFEYDQSLLGSEGVFAFKGLLLTHQICYVVGSGPCTLYKQKQCEPYTITTSGTKLFQLNVTAPSGTPITIKLATNVQLSLTSLPLCMSGTTDVFVSKPQGNASTFTITVSGVTTTYDINSVSCTLPPQTVLPIHRPEPPQQPPAQGCVTCYPVPAPCPVYVCQPRPACCLSRIFHRGFLRVGCR